MKRFCLFGNHPLISLAEVSRVFDTKPAFQVQALAVYETSLDTQKAADALGGLVKAGDIIWQGKRQDFNISLLADWIKKHHTQDKILFGLTIYAENKKDMVKFKHLPIELKKALKPLGKKVRWVTGERGEIRPVTIQKMKLIDEGYDFVFILYKSDIYIGRTKHVQNADAWSHRDYGRPFRDAKTGMLPPKLARMMVNLAVGKKPKKGATLLDPFCGSGTVLMESAMRYPHLHGIGTDIDNKQVRGAERNMQWLHKQGTVASTSKIEWMTSSAQDILDKVNSPIAYIVTEGFLGRPLQGRESRQELERNMHEVQTIWKETLPALGKLQQKDDIMVCVWPEYMVGKETVALKMEAVVKAAGYTRKDKHDLLYGREQQFVRRRIVILRKQRGD